MKLNPDCIRDVMLLLEKILSIELDGRFVCADMADIYRHDSMKDIYDLRDIKYSIIQLQESGYIVSNLKIDIEHFKYSLYYVFYITPKGHEFISSIYNKEAWNTKIKPVFGVLGSVSLSVIEAVAKGVTTATIERIIQTNH